MRLKATVSLKVLGYLGLAVLEGLGSDGSIMSRVLCWPLALWLSLVLAVLAVPGDSRCSLGLQVEMVVPNGIRPLFFLGHTGLLGSRMFGCGSLDLLPSDAT